MDAKDVLGNNDIDDVRWLCSLTESELDLLIGLKNLVNMRANKIGHEDLAKKFDLHMLRTFSFIFMEHLKGQQKDLPVASSNLLKQSLSGSFAIMTAEDLHLYLYSDKRKRFFYKICLPPRSKKLATEVPERLSVLMLKHPLPVARSTIDTR